MSTKCDILVENFKHGDLEKKGLGYEALSENNPGLIYCSITGFGQTGPMKNTPGYDYLIQGQGGLMSITGVPDGEPGAGPLRTGLAVSDLTTGMNAAIAILAALHDRHATGKGQHIDLALLDVQVSWLANQAQNYFTSGNAPVRTGEYHPNLAPYQPFPTRDGSIIIAVGNDAQFQRLCEALEISEVASDPRYSSNPSRVVSRATLASIISAKTKLQNSVELITQLRGLDVPSGPIQSINEVFKDPQVTAREMEVSTHHPAFGDIRTVANPLKFSRTAVEYSKSPPLLSEDTEAVLEKLLDLSPEQIKELRKQDVL